MQGWVKVGHSIRGKLMAKSLVFVGFDGDVVNPEGSTGPWKVVQPLREQSGISTPIRAPLWIHTVVNTLAPSRSSMRTGLLQLRGTCRTSPGSAGR